MMTVRSMLALAAALAVLQCPAQEWPRFRGPNGSGISHARTIPTEISERNLAWKVQLPGGGHSSAVHWGGKIFVTASGGGNGGISLIGVAAADGKLLWRKDFALNPFGHHRYNSLASSTPAVDAERIYLLWTEPSQLRLTALTHDGVVVWERDLGRFVSEHGAGISPIIHDGKVIVGNEQGDSRPGANSFVIAVDARDGKTIWQTERKVSSTSYSTPCVYEGEGGTPALIFQSEAHGIYAVEPGSGKVLWEFDRAFDKRTVSSPIVAGPLILGSCGSGGGGNYVTAVHPGELGAGRPPGLAYQIKSSANYVPTPVARGDLTWLWSDGGVLTCLDTANGEIRFQERVRGNFFASPIWVDGRLFNVSTAGEIVVAEASGQFNILHRYSLGELCHSSPAVALESLFVRTERHLWCFRDPGRSAAD